MTELFDFKIAFQAVKTFFEALVRTDSLFFHLTIQNMRHVQTLVHECFAFSARPVPLNFIFMNFQMESSYVLAKYFEGEI